LRQLEAAPDPRFKTLILPKHGGTRSRWQRDVASDPRFKPLILLKRGGTRSR